MLRIINIYSYITPKHDKYMYGSDCDTEVLTDGEIEDEIEDEIENETKDETEYEIEDETKDETKDET